MSVPPVWVSFLCRSETHTAAGDAFAEAVAEVAQHPAVVAVGLNCTAPAHVEALLRGARARAPKAVLLAYPNSGAAWDAREGHRCWDDSVVDKVLDGSDALAMREAGAALIGGCCNVTHGQIRAFRAALLGEAFSK